MIKRKETRDSQRDWPDIRVPIHPDRAQVANTRRCLESQYKSSSPTPDSAHAHSKEVDSLALTLRSTISYTETTRATRPCSHTISTEPVTPTPSSDTPPPPPRTVTHGDVASAEGRGRGGHTGWTGGWFFKSSHQGSILAWLNARTAHIETDLTRPRAYLSAAHYPRRNSITGAAVDSIFASTCTPPFLPQLRRPLLSPFVPPPSPFSRFTSHRSLT